MKIEHDIQHRDWSESLAAMRAAGGARLIVTSPPYPDARTVERYGGAEFDTSLEGYGRFGEAIFEALIPGGVCALNIDGPVRVWRSEIGESERSLIAFEVAIDWAKRIGFRYVEHCAYSRAGTPGVFGPRWRSGWEPVHLFSRPGADPLFVPDGTGRPAKDAGKAIVGAGGRRPDGSRRIRRAAIQPANRRVTTAEQHFAQDTDPDHAAPFAASLAADYVLSYSQPGDIVGDPLVGSGTVAIVANKHGRRFIGGDLGHRETRKDSNGRDVPCGRRWADIVRERCSQRGLFDGVGSA